MNQVRKGQHNIKRARHLNQQLHRIANQYMKCCPTLLVVREMEMTTTRYPSTTDRLKQWCGEDTEEWELA